MSVYVVTNRLFLNPEEAPFVASSGVTIMRSPLAVGIEGYTRSLTGTQDLRSI